MFVLASLCTAVAAAALPDLCHHRVLLAPGCGRHTDRPHLLLSSYWQCLNAISAVTTVRITNTSESQHDSMDDLRVVRAGATGADHIRHRILLTGGLHGGEIAAPLALVNLLHAPVVATLHAHGIELVVIPVLNPKAVAACSRLGNDRRNWNRALTVASRHPLAARIRAATADLGPFVLGLDLHETVHPAGYFVLANDDDDARLASSAFSRLPRSFPLVRAAAYPYDMPSVLTPNATAYQFVADGVAFSRVAGALKAFMKRELAVAVALTVEAPPLHPLSQRVGHTVDLVLQLVSAAINVTLAKKFALFAS